MLMILIAVVILVYPLRSSGKIKSTSKSWLSP
jgi:hypothetical protein